ncbi:MAG: hypothetical protein ATN36_06310 [Epulopiscium sp. Nele67-Bin005]|nr:MAG: hypothetical protein ATN36_06310 [Epulopiscium sp. Nele67-Bin005]
MKVLLIAFNAKFIHSSLSLRYLKSYCTDYSEQIQLLELTINQDENTIIKEIFTQNPTIIGFSCYIWNIGYIKTLIPTIKKVLPNVKIILGGPEVSYSSRDLLEEFSIDYLVEGEGEETFKQLLDFELSNKISISEIDGLVYKKDGEIIANNCRLPLKMEKLPFVYDDIADLEHKIIYYEASRGCPFNCQYCLSSVEKGVRMLPIERVKQELQYFLDKKVPQVKFVDRTFNASKSYAVSIWEYIIANDNNFTNFHFEIAVEKLDDSMLEVLKGAREGLIQFEIGVQSTHLPTLEAIKRKMPFEKLEGIITQIDCLGNIHQHLDLIVGLPYESYKIFGKSFDDVMSTRPQQLQLGFLKVLKGSGLYIDAKKYGIVYKDEPPYEVLYTNDITYAEILKLHLIEDLLEKYYNSGRFRASLEYFFTILFYSTFEFFESFANYWEAKKYDQLSHKKEAYYFKLLEFGQTLENCDEALLKELIRWDWLCHENPKNKADFLITLDQQQFKSNIHAKFKDDEWLNSFDTKFVDYTPNQRIRNLHVEHFSYNVKQFGIMEHVPIKVHQAVLFDYSYENKQPKFYFIDKI